jgi:hypothetical protein
MKRQWCWPVMSVYADTAPVWMRRTGIQRHEEPVWVNGAIGTGYTCHNGFSDSAKITIPREYWKFV